MGLYDYKNHETTYSALDVVNYALPAKFLLYNSIHYMSPDPSRASRLKGCGYARLDQTMAVQLELVEICRDDKNKAIVNLHGE